MVITRQNIRLLLINLNDDFLLNNQSQWQDNKDFQTYTYIANTNFKIELNT